MIDTNLSLTHGANPVAEILETLMNQHRLNQTELAHRSGVSQPAINRILNERSKAKHPRKETLEKIAAVLGVTPEQLTGEEAISTQMRAKGVVPVLAWESLLSSSALASRKPSAWLACPVEHGDETFILPVVGEAMSGDDGYTEGELLFIDPGVTPTHGKDVVVLQGKTALFRRLVVTPEGRFLKTLNPAWPTPIIALADDTLIYGMVVFSGRVR